jgi:cob(I)alamin adenosyltransferase
MKIYTKTGDKGTTSLIGGKIVPKNNPRIEAYGTTDELISFLALLRDQIINADIRRLILSIQEELMVVAALLATESSEGNVNLPKLNNESIVKLEKEIDRMENELHPLKAFLIPGGHPAVSICHIARTVCRRTERTVITLMNKEKVPDQILVYLNRLSDYLFVLSRALSVDFQCEEIIWKPALNK